MTSPKTRATRRCAENWSRIDLVPSRRVAALWFAWLVVVCLSVMAVDLPWVVRLGLSLVIAAINGRAISRLVLLRGPEALRWIEWEADGRFRIGVGPVDCSEASLRPGAFRLGFAFLMLWFATPRGPRGVLIDGGRQQPAAFRRLSRFLNHRSAPRSGPPDGGS